MPTLSKLLQVTILTGTKLDFIRELEWLRVMSNLYSGGSLRWGVSKKEWKLDRRGRTVLGGQFPYE